MKKNRAFSLIEMLIVLAIIIVVSAISLPIYSQHITRVHRLEAAASLNKLALALEKYASLNQTYEGASLTNLGLNASIKAYHLQILVATKSEFKLAANPIKSEPRCGALTLDSTGEKSFSGAGDFKECWQ